MTKKVEAKKTKKLSVKRATLKDLDVKGQKGAVVRGGKYSDNCMGGTDIR